MTEEEKPLTREDVLKKLLRSAVVIFGTALAYFLSRGVEPYLLKLEACMNSLYCSAVSFTALGYGIGVSAPEGWVKGLGQEKPL